MANNQQDIRSYLLRNPINRDTKHPYDAVAERFGVTTESVRSIWKRMRQSGAVVEDTLVGQPNMGAGESIRQSGDTMEVTKSIDKEVRNLEDLITACSIDTKDWTITNWECKRYNAWIKNKAGDIEKQPMF